MRLEILVVFDVVDDSRVYREGWAGVDPKIGPAVLVSEVVKNFDREGMGGELSRGNADKGGESRWSWHGLRMGI